MKKLYAIATGIVVTLSLGYLLHHQAQASHRRELQACTEKFEQIRYVFEHDSVPWGFLLPYGNPVPRVHGTIDCTGKLTLRRKRIPLPSIL